MRVVEGGAAASARLGAHHLPSTAVPAAVPGPPPAPACQLRVVLAHPVAARRRVLRAVLEADGDVQVLAEARTAPEAAALVVRLAPTALVLDVDLGAAELLSLVEQVMATAPTPILVLDRQGSAAGRGEDPTDTAGVLAAGAVEVWVGAGQGPVGPVEGRQLRASLRVVSRARVITHPRGRLRRTPEPDRAASEPPPSTPASLLMRAPAHPSQQADPRRQADPRQQADALQADPRQADPRRHAAGVSPYRVIAIGASTGGPPAVARLLAELPADLAQVVVVVQHMADGFIPGLVDWLGTQCALPVVVGVDGQRIRPGTVVVAPSGCNLLLRDHLRLRVEPAPAGQHHTPGIDATFHSVAESHGPAAIGVLLTGMGRDGAAGLLAMRSRGAATIGQDEATSAVYGMPAAAAELGAVEMQLPMPEIGPAVVRLLAAVVRAVPTGTGPAVGGGGHAGRRVGASQPGQPDAAAGV